MISTWLQRWNGSPSVGDNADVAVEINNQEKFVSILISKLGDYRIAEIIM